LPSENNLIKNPWKITDTVSQKVQEKPTIIKAVETQKIESIIKKWQNLQQTPDTKINLIADIVWAKKEKITTTIDLNALRAIFMCQQYNYNQESLHDCIDNLPVWDCSVLRIQWDVVSLDSEKILDCIPEVRTFEDNEEDFVPWALYIENYDTEIDKKIVFLQQFIPWLHVWGHNIFAPYLPWFARIEFDPSISKRDLYGIMKYLWISKEELLPSNPAPIPAFKTAKIIGLGGNETEFSKFLEHKIEQSTIRQHELAWNADQIIFNTQTIQESIQKKMRTTSTTPTIEENSFTNFLKEKKQKSIVRQSYNDPLVDDQNYLQTIRYPEALQICDSKASRNINIAIIDSAFDVHHEDFWWNVIYTKDVANNDSIVMTPIGQEYDTEWAHGTYSLWIIWAVSDNQKGIMSLVDKYTSISLYKAAADQWRGQDIWYWIESLIVAAKSKPDIISLSWGAYINDKKSLSYLEKVVEKILNQGTVIVASAGNYNKNDLFYPAAIEWVIAVWAIDSSSKKATFSNYWSRVDVAAPGVEVMTTAPNNDYKKINGTSESAPVVTVALAWIMSKWWTWYDIATTLSPLTTLDVGRWSINLAWACNSLKQSLENVEKEHASSTPIIDDESPLFEIQFAKGETLPIQLIFLLIFMILLTVWAWKLVMYREHHWVEKNPE
jgi:thermitase